MTTEGAPAADVRPERRTGAPGVPPRARPFAEAPGALVTAGYLAVTTPLLPAGGLRAASLLVLAAHVGVLALLVVSALRRARGAAGPRERRALDLHPLLLLPLLYAELPFLMEGVPGPVVYHDPLVQRVELALFGFQPAWELAGRFPHGWLSELLHAGYLGFYPIIYVPPLLLLARRAADVHARERALQETLLALALTVAACFLVFALWPVQGPRYLAAPAGVPGGPLRAAALAVLEGGSSRGAAFPSSHVAIAVTQTLLALRHQRAVGTVLAAVTVLLAAGAVYGGFHYAVDVVAGALVGGLAAWAAEPVWRAVRGPDAGFTPAPKAV